MGEIERNLDVGERPGALSGRVRIAPGREMELSIDCFDASSPVVTDELRIRVTRYAVAVGARLAEWHAPPSALYVRAMVGERRVDLELYGRGADLDRDLLERAGAEVAQQWAPRRAEVKASVATDASGAPAVAHRPKLAWVGVVLLLGVLLGLAYLADARLPGAQDTRAEPPVGAQPTVTAVPAVPRASIAIAGSNATGVAGAPAAAVARTETPVLLPPAATALPVAAAVSGTTPQPASVVATPPAVAAAVGATSATAAPTASAEPIAATAPTAGPVPLPANALSAPDEPIATNAPTAAAEPSAAAAPTATGVPVVTWVPTPRTVLAASFNASALPRWPNAADGPAWFASDGYHVRAQTPGRFVAIGAPLDSPVTDAAVTLRSRKVSGPPGGGVGIIVRDQQSAQRDGLNQAGRYYVFEVSDRGEVGIWRRETDVWVDLVPWTRADAVRPATEGNVLEARVRDTSLSLSVNGRQVASTTDGELRAGGVGVFLGGDSTEAVLHKLSVTTLD